MKWHQCCAFVVNSIGTQDMTFTNPEMYEFSKGTFALRHQYEDYLIIEPYLILGSFVPGISLILVHLTLITETHPCYLSHYRFQLEIDKVIVH